MSSGRSPSRVNQRVTASRPCVNQSHLISPRRPESPPRSPRSVPPRPPSGRSHPGRAETADRQIPRKRPRSTHRAPVKQQRPRGLRGLVPGSGFDAPCEAVSMREIRPRQIASRWPTETKPAEKPFECEAVLCSLAPSRRGRAAKRAPPSFHQENARQPDPKKPRPRSLEDLQRSDRPSAPREFDQRAS